MSNSLSFGNHRNSNRGGRMRWPLIVFIILVFITLFVTGGALFKENGQARDNMPTATPTPTPIPSPTPIEATPTPTPKTAKKPTEEAKQIASGPYGLWEATPTPTPTMYIPPGTVIWMEGWEDTRTPVDVKGIYLSGDISGSKSSVDKIVSLVERTELNAIVIDVKNDYGKIVYDFENEEFTRYGGVTNNMYFLKDLVAELHAKGIYAIARIVSFKDSTLANARPDLAYYYTDGTRYRDNDGHSWVSIFKQEVWEYLAEIGVECARIGFDEINFDYMRAPTDKTVIRDGNNNIIREIDFGEEHKTKTVIEAVTEGVKYLCETLRKEGVYISGDVYGAIIGSPIDTRTTGQDYIQLAQYLDYICPMIYPSHYAFGWRNYKYPDKEPYNVIKQALTESTRELDTIPAYLHRAVVRPWLQDFTAKYLGQDSSGVDRFITYDAQAVREQIQASYDTDHITWFLWNSGSYYTEDALMPAESD